MFKNEMIDNATTIISFTYEQHCQFQAIRQDDCSVLVCADCACQHTNLICLTCCAVKNLCKTDTYAAASEITSVCEKIRSSAMYPMGSQCSKKPAVSNMRVQSGTVNF